MTTTSNLQTVKSGLITALAALAGLSGVTVAYKEPRDFPRECIYGGRLSAPQNYGAMKSGADTVRDEDGSITLHVYVEGLGSDAATVEARAVALIGQVEGYFATLTESSLDASLINAFIASWDVDSYYTDDSVVARATITVQTQSTLM